MNTSLNGSSTCPAGGRSALGPTKVYYESGGFGSNQSNVLERAQNGSTSTRFRDHQRQLLEKDISDGITNKIFWELS